MKPLNYNLGYTILAGFHLIQDTKMNFHGYFTNEFITEQVYNQVDKSLFLTDNPEWRNIKSVANMIHMTERNIWGINYRDQHV